MKLAIITGGSKGLGKGLFEQLGEMGYQLIEFSRSAPYEVSHQMDMANPMAARQVTEEALAELNVDGLKELLVINNAAINTPIGSPDAHAPEAVIAHLNINIASQILFLSAVLAKFKDVTGRKVIGNISSGAASYAFKGNSLYCASKAATEQFVRTVAAEQEQASAPFTLININPSVMDTDMQAVMRDTSAADFPEVAQYIALKEAGQLPSPADTASAVIRILTYDSLVNGELYHVDNFR